MATLDPNASRCATAEHSRAEPLERYPHERILERLEREVAGTRRTVRALRAELAERVAMLDAIQNAERHYRTVLEHAPAAVVHTDPMGMLVYANRACRELFGVHDAQLEAGAIWEILDWGAAREGVRGLFLVGGRIGRRKTLASTIAAFRRVRTGTEVVVEIRRTWARDERGRVAGAVASLVDVTARELRETQLADAAEAFRDLFDRAPVMLLQVDAESACVVQCNAAAADALGLTANEVLDRSLFELYAEVCLDDVADDVRRLVHGDAVYDRPRRLADRAGRFVYETACPVRDQNGRVREIRIAWRSDRRSARAWRPPR